MFSIALGNIEAMWPEGLVDLFAKLSIFSFNVELTAPECVSKFDFKW